MKDIYRKEHMRRMLGRYSKFNISGLFKTRKGKSGENWLFFESYLENAFFNQYEFEPSIVTLESQPLSISYYFRGRKRFYTPDIGLVQFTGNELIEKYKEVKHSSLMKDEETRNKYKRVRRVFKKLGYEFEVVTEKNLKSEQALRNLEIIYKSIGHITSSSPLIDDALSFIPNHTTFGEASIALKALQIDTSVLFYLLYKQLYQFELNQPLRSDTVLTRNIH
ncbi:Tn7 transposase TnsA N-terminal domain-containing protein [Alteromonas sp. 1_MG-2023]|uniref:Tn7 transposase TnsA N-terminal domain-containing protein n=1 Tax=Alteromonas sp. 1_MG-2023 TaxID=3062669 RepID=UPI0026E32BC7|nr:Tn7 transposase TnsA N-terminal domain-containing protein [Alteromonas sp. 1_MG-2023]MDO6566265.1 Tn7 transposase TnsA N-terminal domain-containing protein [Alteromonas sp. 1_MG-2023]